MKRFVNVSVIALILAGLCACASQSSLQTDAIKLGNSRELFSLSDFVEPIKFISLESSDSCMIRFVRKVIQTHALPEEAGLPPFDEEKTDVILMLWRIKK